MGGEKRRENLLKILQESESAVSGTKLATKFQVSITSRKKSRYNINTQRLCTSGQRKHSESF